MDDLRFVTPFILFPTGQGVSKIRPTLLLSMTILFDLLWFFSCVSYPSYRSTHGPNYLRCSSFLLFYLRLMSPVFSNTLSFPWLYQCFLFVLNLHLHIKSTPLFLLLLLCFVRSRWLIDRDRLRAQTSPLTVRYSGLFIRRWFDLLNERPVLTLWRLPKLRPLIILM